MKFVSNLIGKLESHQVAAIVIAVIVALADAVIVYDLHLSGAWLSPSWLSWLKTAAFVLLFIGSLIAEMQQLRFWTRVLLFVAVLLLGAYQASVNVVVNYHAAQIPQSAVAFFETLKLTPLQVTFWYAIVDGMVRTTVVVLMWLVCGLTWRGIATDRADASDALTELQAEAEQLRAANERLQVAVDAQSKFTALEPRDQVRWILSNRTNGDGPTNAELAERYGVHPSTINRWRR